MFTGIIEAQGRITLVENNGLNKTFWLESPLSKELNIDESLSHDGVCLTIEDISDEKYKVTAIKETLVKTNLYTWIEGYNVNLERAMLLNDRLDGHIVQGHVDATTVCTNRMDLKGSIELTFKFDKKFTHLIIEKGSVCLNGVSLTAFKVRKKKFTVAIIPYTWQHTNLSGIQVDSTVNIEFDILGKYVQRMSLLQTKKSYQD